MKTFAFVTTAMLLAASPALAFTTGKEANHLCHTGKLEPGSLSSWTWVEGSAYVDQRLRCRPLVPVRQLEPGEGVQQLKRELDSGQIIVKPAFLATSGPQPAHHNGAYTDQRSAPAASQFQGGGGSTIRPSAGSVRADGTRTQTGDLL